MLDIVLWTTPDRSKRTVGSLREHSERVGLPRTNKGWFFRAESFFDVARYVDRAALSVNEPPPNFLSHSHGEVFLRFFAERCARPGIYIVDEPEAALSPLRQVAFLRLLDRMRRSETAQVILATHSPILMACPNATLLGINHRGLASVLLEETSHFNLLERFTRDPRGTIADMLAAGDDD